MTRLFKVLLLITAAHTSATAVEVHRLDLQPVPAAKPGSTAWVVEGLTVDRSSHLEASLELPWKLTAPVILYYGPTGVESQEVSRVFVPGEPVVLDLRIPREATHSSWSIVIEPRAFATSGNFLWTDAAAIARLVSRRGAPRSESGSPAGENWPHAPTSELLFTVNAVPNPFNPSTAIQLSLQRAADVSVTIYSVRGELVAELQSGRLPQGEHEFEWRGRDGRGRAVASGVYYLRIEADGVLERRKLSLLK